MEAVEVKSVEADFRGRVALNVVVGPEPLDEAQHISVSPHPCGEPPKASERGVGILVGRHTHHISVDPVGVRPISLDGDDREAQFVDQAPGDPGALAIELMGAMGCLADQDEAPVADEAQQRVVILDHACDRCRRPPQCLG